MKKFFVLLLFSLLMLTFSLASNAQLTTDNLILHYRADNIDGSGTKATQSTLSTTWSDLTGNGNDGTLTGFTFTPGSGWSNVPYPFTENRIDYNGNDTDDIVTVANESSFDFTPDLPS